MVSGARLKGSVPDDSRWRSMVDLQHQAAAAQPHSNSGQQPRGHWNCDMQHSTPTALQHAHAHPCPLACPPPVRVEYDKCVCV